MGPARAFFALVVPGIVTPFAVAPAADAPASSGYVVLDDQFSQLRDDFNQAKGSVRLLFVVDPICPGCLRGMDDMNRDLLSHTKDERIKTFVVHVPVIGAKAKDVMPAAQLLQNPHVRNYWNDSGEFGRALTKAVQLKNDKEAVYAWDVWLLYGPDAEWVGTSPPQPKLLMHQLWKLEGTQFAKLDSKLLLRVLLLRLAQMSSDPSRRYVLLNRNVANGYALAGVCSHVALADCGADERRDELNVRAANRRVHSPSLCGQCV